MRTQTTNPTCWISSFYFTEGMLFGCIIPMSIIMYKNFHATNALITLLSSLFSLSWIIKPLFAPAFEMIATKKRLVIMMQLSLALLFLLLALSIGHSFFLTVSIILLLMLSCCAAIHDTAADGYFLQSLTLEQRTHYISLTNFFYHFSRIPSNGLLIMLVGYVSSISNHFIAWRLNYILIAITLLSMAVYHRVILIENETVQNLRQFRFTKFQQAFKQVLIEFKQIHHVTSLVILLLIYNVAEAQLLRVVPLFLLDKPVNGGLGITTVNVGLILGGFGIVAIMLGNLLAGYLIKRYQLTTLLLLSTCNLLLFNTGYLVIIFASIQQISLITFIIMLARLSFGFSISIFMAVLVRHFSRASLKMSVYAIGTSLMYLGMLLPGAISGWLQQLLGYKLFFLWITLLQFVVVYYCYWFARQKHVSDAKSEVSSRFLRTIRR